MKMNIKFKIDKVNLELDYEEASDLRDVLHDYIVNVKDDTIKTCCDDMLEAAEKILKQLNSMDRGGN